MVKKIFIALIVLLFFLIQVSLSAPEEQNMQKATPAEKFMQKKEAGILNLIPDLTDSQKQAIKVLINEEKQKINEIRKHYREKIEKVLTPEQLKALKNKIADKMVEGQISRMTKMLNLSIEQQYQMKLIFKKYQSSLEASKDKENKKKVMEQVYGEIKKILNDEQKAKLEKIEKLRKHKGKGAENGSEPYGPTH